MYIPTPEEAARLWQLWDNMTLSPRPLSSLKLSDCFYEVSWDYRGKSWICDAWNAWRTARINRIMDEQIRRCPPETIVNYIIDAQVERSMPEMMTEQAKKTARSFKVIPNHSV